jgi:GntR family transcriptional regulator / MocR family aminotransferase
MLALDGRGTLVEQLVRALRAEIENWSVGTRMPPTRVLAGDLGISRNAVVDAYGELANDGLLTGRFGGGSYVSALDSSASSRDAGRRARPPTRPAKPTATLSRFARRLESLDASPILERPGLDFDFRYGLPVVASFPFPTWARLVARRAKAASVAVLGYGEAAGYAPLRAEVAEYLRRARGIACLPEQVLITNGSQQALDLAARILVEPGDRVFLEEPSYEGARQVFSAAGATIVAVPVDGDGLRVGELPSRSRRGRAVYVTPSHQFPTGAVLSVTRRRELLRWARAHDAYVIEDDYDGELRYDIRPIQAIKGGDVEERVIYVGTMSKVLFPSLRLGYVVSPPGLISSFVKAKHVCDRQTPALLQMALADFMKRGHFARHLLRARRLCAQRRTALLAALDRHLGRRVTVEGVNAGIHVLLWVKNRSARDVPAIVERARELGVGIYPIAPYFVRPPRRAGFLLGYASMDEARIAAGIERLARVLS